MQTDSKQLDLEEAILLSEIDLEISLRERLATTLESRIKWASLLEDALNNETTDVSQIVFKDAALNALTAIDANSDILFTRENFVPASVTHSVNNAPKKPAPKEKPLTRSQKSKFIYLRSSPLESQGGSAQNQIYILRCPTCLRTAFTNLQGVYNHARISHNIGWGTHEECVKACSVLKEEVEAQAGHELELEAGIDIGSGAALLPGVKSLFQMAVEGTRDRVTGDVGTGQEMNTGEERSVHLTKTLGLHGDSPALAQFLGKEARRKAIKVRVENENAEVDIFGLDQELKRHWRRPNAHLYGSRSESDADIISPPVKDEDLKPLVEVHNGSKLSEESTTPAVQSSRFRMACRIIITDSSLFIPPEQRSENAKEHTHKWMISIESASYSIDLTTILTSMTVTSIPLPDMDPMDFNPIPPLTATEPPYLVVGTTSEPFHAQIELVFNPGGSTHGGEPQKIILEHWVGLDMLGTSKSPVKGDEQMVDVELDKDTELRPAKTGYTPPNSKLHWESKKDDEVKDEKDEKDGFSSEPGVNSLDVAKVGKSGDIGSINKKKPMSWEDVLKSLLPRFPMTMKDVTPTASEPTSNRRGKASNANSATNDLKLPYKLVANQDELNGLVIGRRKAIEWGRAKTIRDAYTERIKEYLSQESTSLLTNPPDPSDPPLPSTTIVNTELAANSNLIPLTVGDVFCWLEDEGHFYREPLPVPSGDHETATQAEDTSKETRWAQLLQDGKWCKVCGLGLWAHGILDIPDPASVTANQSGHGRRASTVASNTTLAGTVFPRPTEPGLYDIRGHPITRESLKCDIIPAAFQMVKMPIVNVQRIFLKHIQRREQQVREEAEKEDTEMDIDADSVVDDSSSTRAQSESHTLSLPAQERASLITTTPSTSDDISAWQSRLRNRALVNITDPRLTEHLRTCISSLNLRTFQPSQHTIPGPNSSNPGPEYPLSSIAPSSIDVDATLAPYSLLALVAKSFVRYLVKEGLEISSRDKDLGLGWMHQNHIRDVGLVTSGLAMTGSSRRSKAAAAFGVGGIGGVGVGSGGGGGGGGGRSRGKEKDKEKVKVQTTRVLTPMHIIAGVVSGYVKAGSKALTAAATAPHSTATSVAALSALGTTSNSMSAAASTSAGVAGPLRYVPGAGAGTMYANPSTPTSTATVISSQERMTTAVAVFGCLARLGIGVDGFDLDLAIGSGGPLLRSDES